jgi:hypothetical protein
MRASLRKLFDALRWALALSLSYGVISFAWSTLGFLTPVTPVHLHEYPLRSLLVEVGGHVLFGLVAALPTMDISLILLCGGEAILIDADHVMGALSLPVQTRLSHSIGFILLGPLVMGRIATKNRGFSRPVTVVTFASVLAHLSYDVFAGNGSVPIFDPASIGFFTLPYWSWLPLEVGAFAVCGYLGISSRRESRADSSAGAFATRKTEG